MEQLKVEELEANCGSRGIIKEIWGDKINEKG